MAIIGAAPYGPGTPAVKADVSGTVRRNSYSGESNGSRKIDPQTRDYVRDATTGRALGMTNAQQLVYLAVKTEFHSSAMRALGQTIRQVKRIGPNFEREIDTRLRSCVAHIVDQSIIEVIDTVIAQVRPGVAFARLRWRDISDGTENNTNVGEFASGA